MFESHYDCPCLEKCPLSRAVAIVGGKWKMQTLCTLSVSGSMRFSALRRRLGSVSDAGLSTVLKELIRDGMVTRHDFCEPVPRVEYTVTEKALSLMPIIEELGVWVEKNDMAE